MKKQKTTTNQFCLDILKLGVGHKKALANLVMALSSYKAASVVELSESPLFHYQYSSINDAISHLVWDPPSTDAIERQIQGMCLGHYWHLAEEYVELQTDKTPIPKAHSATLPERMLIAIPNCKVPGNRPLDIGYEYSFVNLCADQGRWSLPLSARSIPLDQTPSQIAARQIVNLFAQQPLPLHGAELVVNYLDTGYASATYIDAVKDIANLVSVIRLRKGSKVYASATAQEAKPGKVPKIYGQQYYLLTQSGYQHFKKHPKTKEPYKKWRTAITEKPPDEQTSYCQLLSNGRAVLLQVRRWNDLLMRTKDGIPMQDKPFSVVLVELTDAISGQALFKDPMFLGVFGQKRSRLSGEQIQSGYRKRYGIEPFFRFVKRDLLLDKYQTSSAQYLQNWAFVIILAVWLLFTARNVLPNRPKKWQKYNAPEKTGHQHGLSITQAHKAMQPYLLTFDQEPFLPQKSKPGPGRRKGQTQIQRTKYPYRKKTVNRGQRTRDGPN